MSERDETRRRGVPRVRTTCEAEHLLLTTLSRLIYKDYNLINRDGIAGVQLEFMK